MARSKQTARKRKMKAQEEAAPSNGAPSSDVGAEVIDNHEVVQMTDPPNDGDGDGSSQSESMGRSDGEEEGEEAVPMKEPAGDGGENDDDDGAEADESFLDDDFLSFDNVDNGGDGANGSMRNGNGANGVMNGGGGRLAGRKRERSPSPVPGSDYGQRCSVVPTIPWLDGAAQRPPPPQQQQQQQWGRNRGYGGHSNNYNYTPPSYTPPLIRLHNEIVSFVNLMKPTEEELAMREKMVERVTDLAHRIFGGKDKCQVLPFGSQVTGLCLPGSDIDFVIRFPKSKNGNGAKEGAKTTGEEDEDYATTTSNPLRRFADAVKDEFGVRAEDDENEGVDDDDDSEHLSYLEVIEQTRVPLVKFTVAPYNIDVDVCFDQPNGPEAAELMHRFMESMPPLRPLAFVLKYFLASRDINKPYSGGIGSYLLQLMIVSYLQHRAREDQSRGLLGDGRNFNLGSLLLDFLELYGLDFNYVTTAVSVRHDGYYFPKGQRETKDVFWQPSRPFSLAMENPLDPTMDVGAGAFRMGNIKRVFQHAFKILLAYVSEPITPTDSILAQIIPPTGEMRERMALKREEEVVDVEEEDHSMPSNGYAADRGGGGGKMKRSKQTPRNKKERERMKEQKKAEKKWHPPQKKQKHKRHSDGGGGGGGKKAKKDYPRGRNKGPRRNSK